MRHEWDPPKAEANLRKHGIRFADAVTTLEDDLALTIQDPDSTDEERMDHDWLDGLGRLLVVVFTWRADAIRIISARPAAPRECREYEEGYEKGI